MFYDHEHVSVAWSPDGKRLASTDFAGEIRVRDPDTCRQLWEQYPLPIGHWIRVPGHGKLWAYPTGPDNTVLAPPTTRCIAWSPVRNLLACGANETVQIFDGANGRQELVLGEHLGYVNGVAWSPAGRQLVGHLSRVSPLESQVAPAFQPVTPTRRLALPKATIMTSDPLASCGDEGVVRVWDLDFPRK